MDRTSVCKGKGAIGALLMSVCVLLTTRAAYSQTSGYAIEVATMRSQEGAVGLANGLIARGYAAYLVKADRVKSGVIYRVRLGKFPTLDFARAYAESLLNSGLLNACAITLNNPLKQDDTAKSESRPEELLVALSKVQWTLSANRSIAYSLPPRGSSSSGSPANDIVVLMRAIEKTGWKMRTDPAILTRAASDRTSAINAVADTKSGAAAAPPAAPLSVIDTFAAAFNKMLSRATTENLKSLISTSTVAAIMAPASGVGGVETEVPDVTKVGGAPPRQAVGPLTSPRLSGSVEMRGGRLVMLLKNLDRQRAFNGIARVTLNDGKNENDITPVLINLQPSEEKLVPLDDPSTPYGDSVLVVYDVKRAVQLIRSVPFGNRPTVAKPKQQPEPDVANIQEEFNSLGEDDRSFSDPATLANPDRENRSPNVTTAFEGEIEGAPAQKIPKEGEIEGVPAQKIPKPNN